MMSFRRSRMWTVLCLAGVLVAAAGCVVDNGASGGPETANGVAQAPVAEETAAAEPDDVGGPAHQGARHGHGPGGPEHLLRAALHELDLTDAQKGAIQGALDKLPAHGKGHGPKHQAAFAALAAGVRAGKIDAAAVQAKAAEGGPDIEAHRAAVADALQTLHAALTKPQRRALVDAVTKRMQEHGPKDMPRMGKGPHGPGGERGGFRGPVGHLLAGIELTEGQRTAIARALEAQKPGAVDHEAMKGRFEAMRAEMQTRLDTFAADTFDAKAFMVPPGGDSAEGPKPHFGRMVETIAVVVPILDAAQRETLAARIEKGPPGPMGGHGMHGPGHRGGPGQ